jgi:hypothetical protein
MVEKSKTVLIYLLVIFLAIFVGTSIFLIFNNKKSPSVKKTTGTVVTIPTVKPTEGSLNLISEKEKISLSADKEVIINLVADSNEKNIVGYDLVLSYDPLAFTFVNATSNITDFQIYTYKRDNYVSFLAAKTVQSQTQVVFTQTKIASFVFRPLKTGKFNFSLKPLIGKDKTDLVTDKTEVFSPKLNELKIEVF